MKSPTANQCCTHNCRQGRDCPARKPEALYHTDLWLSLFIFIAACLPIAYVIFELLSPL